ncbi:MAG TPA: TetR/AcrR family transcriptional regulator [Solirubrobacterales bacterium]|nr:TetR/AcrR family transcriptional regulator [Solirubrobacterales bacterium]
MLDAATEVIAERGIAATRIADVAERAGTSPPAVLYWFDSKDELLTEALAHEEGRFRAQLVERLDGTSASERVAILIDASCGGSDWRLWMELWTRALHDREAGRTRRELDRLWRREIATTVEAGQRAGEFAQADAGEVAAHLASFLDGLAVQVALGDPEMPIERMSELARQMAERLLDCSLPAPEGYGDEVLEAVA